ncbi:hypothetical protein QCA50_007202 [Cerrena zonata]|uniref:Uncharacterized protein n=1 Tax=Cerrena zonata TaxID=2478898 RepID=A0AAW0GJZ8_9APHY
MDTVTDVETTTITITTFTILSVVGGFPSISSPPTSSNLSTTTSLSSETRTLSSTTTISPLFTIQGPSLSRSPLPSAQLTTFWLTPIAGGFATSTPSSPSTISSSGTHVPTSIVSATTIRTNSIVQSHSQPSPTSLISMSPPSQSDGSRNDGSSSLVDNSPAMGGIIFGGTLGLVALFLSVLYLIVRWRDRKQRELQPQSDMENGSTPDLGSLTDPGEEIVVYKGTLSIFNSTSLDEKPGIGEKEKGFAVKRPESKPSTVTTSADDGMSISTIAVQSLYRGLSYINTEDQYNSTPTKLRPDSDILPPVYQEEIPPVPPLPIPDTPTSATSLFSQGHRMSTRIAPRGPRPARIHSTRRRTASTPSYITSQVPSSPLSPNIPTVQEDSSYGSADAGKVLPMIPSNPDRRSTPTS